MFFFKQLLHVSAPRRHPQKVSNTTEYKHHGLLFFTVPTPLNVGSLGSTSALSSVIVCHVVAAALDKMAVFCQVSRQRRNINVVTFRKNWLPQSSVWMPKWYGGSDRYRECSLTAGSNQPTVTLHITFTSPIGETRNKWPFVVHITSQCLETMLSHLHDFCSSDWLISLKLVPNLHVSFHILLTEIISSPWKWRKCLPSKRRNG